MANNQIQTVNGSQVSVILTFLTCEQLSKSCLSQNHYFSIDRDHLSRWNFSKILWLFSAFPLNFLWIFAELSLNFLRHHRTYRRVICHLIRVLFVRGYPLGLSRAAAQLVEICHRLTSSRRFFSFMRWFFWSFYSSQTASKSEWNFTKISYNSA